MFLSGYRRTSEIPLAVRTARRFMWFQVFIMMLVFALVTTENFLSGEIVAFLAGGDDPDYLWLPWSPGGLNFRVILGVAVGTLAANLVTRLRWVRNVSAVVEVLVILEWVRGLVYSQYLSSESPRAAGAIEGMAGGVAFLSALNVFLAFVVLTQLASRDYSR